MSISWSEVGTKQKTNSNELDGWMDTSGMKNTFEAMYGRYVHEGRCGMVSILFSSRSHRRDSWLVSANFNWRHHEGRMYVHFKTKEQRKLSDTVHFSSCFCTQLVTNTSTTYSISDEEDDVNVPPKNG